MVRRGLGGLWGLGKFRAGFGSKCLLVSKSNDETVHIGHPHELLSTAELSSWKS